MAPEIDESTPEYQEFLAWKASQPEKPEAGADVVDDTPLTDTEVLRAAHEEATGPVETNVATGAPDTVEEEAPVPVTAVSGEKALTDEEARRVAEESLTETTSNEQGQTDDAGVIAPVAPAPKAFDESSYEFEVTELVKRDGPVPGTKTYGLVVKRSPMPSATPDGTVLPGYVVASLGVTNEVLSTSQDLGLEKL